VVLLFAFLARNLLLSGYLFYPVYQIDFFSFDWKADPEAASRIASFIKYFNRVPSLPAEETRKLSGISWLPLWFLDLQPYDKLIIVTGVSGFCFSPLLIRKTAGISKPAALFVLVMIAQLTSWLFTAPDTRFAYGPLLAGSYLLTTVFDKQTQYFLIKPVKMTVYLLMTTAVLLYSTIKVIRHRDYRNVAIPVLLPSPPVHITRLNDIEFRTPEKILGNWNARCFGTDLPCLYIIQPGLQPRSNQIRDGFKIKK